MRLDSLFSAEREASLSVQPQEEDDASRIQSRDGSDDGVGCGRSVSRARPSWLRRALGGLLKRNHPAAVEAPERARERAPTETPRWRSSLKKAVACVCKPVCSGAHDDDVVLEDPRIKSRRRHRRRRRQRRGICSGARSPPEAVLTGESEDYWTFAVRGGSSYSSLADEMLMRRFVLAEDAMRRRAGMRVVDGVCWCPPGPSRLSQMSLANDDDNGGRSS